MIIRSCIAASGNDFPLHLLPYIQLFTLLSVTLACGGCKPVPVQKERAVTMKRTSRPLPLICATRSSPLRGTPQFHFSGR